MEHGLRSLHDGTQDAVQASQHDHVEEQDADAQAEGTQHAEHVHRFGAREELPHAVGDVKERAQGGDGRGQRHHRLAQFGHLVIQLAQDTVQAVEG